MKRRAFLATGAVLATAGCLGRAGTGGDDSTPTSVDDDCPDVSDGTDATVCSGTAENQPASFGQSADRVAVGETLEVTLANDSADEVGLNPYDWRVHRETEDGWEPVDRGAVIEPWVVLEAGERVRWRVGVGETADTDTGPEDVYGGTLALESGQRYAFSVSVDVDEDRVVFVAPFSVE
ncbi:hypothetical protein [Halobacterium rubrum]|uniref:hypothetical protein n=1 Tax=Halobacterium TaxID=2239 RepID=UPI001F285270|nr:MULTISPECIES: hypothetical protein [Halobacterium]MDH5021551.1 hypothetical protein [Halobacterium rubrum]